MSGWSWTKMRREVLVRDDWTCQNCDFRSTWSDEPMHVDHIVPKSRGGNDVYENLQVLCGLCNMNKQSKTMQEWEQSGGAAGLRHRNASRNEERRKREQLGEWG